MLSETKTWNFSLQNISPGLVENDILTTAGTDNNELVKYMPRLKPEEVAKAIIFVITTSADVLVIAMFYRVNYLN